MCILDQSLFISLLFLEVEASYMNAIVKSFVTDGQGFTADVSLQIEMKQCCCLCSYYAAVGFMLALVGAALPFALLGLDWELGRAEKKNATFRQAFVVNHNVSSLSVARLFLFASRDLWFEVTLPYFLRSPAGLDWSRLLVGIFLAVRLSSLKNAIISCPA